MKTTKYIIYSLFTVFLLLGFTNAVFAEESVSGEKNQHIVINNKGKIEIKNAVLETVSSSLITARAWGMLFNVNLTTDTTIIRRFGSKESNVNTLSAGDMLNIKGVILESPSQTIQASQIKDTSIQKIQVEKTGIIQSISGTDFVLRIDSAQANEFTVKTDSDTKILLKREVKQFSDLKVGDRVAAFGVKNRSNLTIFANKIEIKTVTTERGVRKNAKANYIGLVKTVDSANKTFVFTNEKSGNDYTVKVVVDTKIKRRDNDIESFSDIEVGKRVQVRGILNKEGDNAFITASKIIILQNE